MRKLYQSLILGNVVNKKWKTFKMVAAILGINP